MTVLLTADWHLSAHQRDQYRNHVITALPDLCAKHDVKQVIMLGDITEAKDRHDAALTNRIVRYVRKITKVCPITFLRGNHDYQYENVAFFRFLREIEWVRFIEYPTFASVEGLGAECLFLPHTRNHKKDWGKVEFHKKHVRVVFAHNLFVGARSGKHVFSNGVPTNAIPSHLKVFSGDVHEPQNIAHITYVGAPYTVDFSDDYQGRVILLKRNDRGEIKWRSIWLDNADKRTIVASGVDSFTKQARALTKGCLLRVIITKHKAGEWNAIDRTIRNAANDLGLYIYVVTPRLAERVKTIERAVRHHVDDQALIKQYCAKHAISDAQKQIGLAIIKGLQ